ncbi:MAG: hypothetical protein KDK54_19370, partial [Leptospiraceae bacterium]|nr:hypothetical protein [Leptospiraceae bacterium]
MADNTKKEHLDTDSQDDFQTNFEDFLDFDFYVDDISSLNEESFEDEFSQPGADEEVLNELIDTGSLRDSERSRDQEIDDLLDSSSDEYEFETGESGDIELSESDVRRIENEAEAESFRDPDTIVDKEFEKELSDDENVTLGEDELNNILNSNYTDSTPSTPGPFVKPSIENLDDSNDNNLEVDLNEDSDDLVFENSNRFDNILSEAQENLDDDYSSQEFLEDTDEIENTDLETDLPDFEEDDGMTKSFFDEEDESITLSPDELGNITGDEEEDDLDSDDLPSFEEDDVPEDESITLSPDELGNITGDDEDESIFDQEEGPEISEEADGTSVFDEEDDSITLSPDELGNITGDDEDESIFDQEEGPEITEEADGTSVFDEEEDDSITLSPDELGNITGEDDEGSIFDQEDDTDLEEEADGTSALDEEDDSITLSPDELGNITGEDDEGSIFDQEDGTDLEEEADGTSALDEEEDDSITLSPDELGNITGEDEEGSIF